MKPTFLCSECRNTLQWGDQFCGSCGKPVEWPHAVETPAERPGEKTRARQGAQKPPRQAISWKMMAVFAMFLVGGVVLLELVTGPRNIPSSAVQTAEPEQGANIQAREHLNELERRADANPEDLETRLHLANFAHDNRFYDKAIDSYKKYLEKNPKNADALVDLGICYNDIGSLEEARRIMEQALKISPKHLLGHFNLGIVNLRAGDLEKANEWFRRTVALDPDSEVAKRAQQLLTQHVNVPTN